ncbi:MAG: type II toxin-antitoxin system HicA family toxin [Saprospiraceae bacterium]|nr:type II toxin-antitoxin system HicA family toxin [Candidatus Defluviibacterium haderslevense]
MRTLSGKDICVILSKHGFIKVRQKGSHVIMQKLTEDSTITVPVPMHKEIKIGTLHSIIRQSELTKRDFE